MLFPNTCHLCLQPLRSGQRFFCPPCHQDLPWLSKSCQQCATPIISDLQQCSACFQNPPAFNHALSLFNYDDPINHLLLQHKHQEAWAMARCFALQFRQKLKTQNQPWPTLLTPVPLHTSRHQERGFNQSEILTRAFSKTLDIPYKTDLIERVRATEHQMGQKAKERRKNLKHAFELKAKAPLENIAIIDDVITTGSTVGSMAKCLKQAGVPEISVWSIARA